jgi:hypothetical protein
MVGVGLLILALVLWEARNFIPTLATTRVVATALLWTLHDAYDADVPRAFAVALKRFPAEATLEREEKSAGRGVSYLRVTADTSERAKADLTALTSAIQAVFPSAERNLSVSPNNSTVPAPNQLSERISFFVRAAVVFLLLGAQLLMVVGAYRRQIGRGGLFATIATPFLLLLFPTDTSRGPHSNYTRFPYTDYSFLLVLLAVTPMSLILILWLTRAPHGRVPRKRSG